MNGVETKKDYNQKGECIYCFETNVTFSSSFKESELVCILKNVSTLNVLKIANVVGFCRIR